MRKKKAVSPVVVPGPVTVAAPAASLWPAEFARPRTAIIIALALGLFTAVLFALGYTGYLHGIKTAMAFAFGLPNPERLVSNAWDLAVVVWLLGLVLGAGLVHPSLGLGILVLLRPWSDGYTHPFDNVYFLWAIWILFVCWAVQTIFRGGSVRAGKPALLLGGFVAVALIGLSTGYQFDNTYRNALLWFGYLSLFFLTCNTLRSRQAFGILMTVLLLSIAIETVYSIIQFNWMLVLLRKVVRNPAVLRQYFGYDTMTPELARRFNINRAFGSMLFPNALAGFLILGIPCVVTGAIHGWRDLWSSWWSAPIPQYSMSSRYRAIATGLLAWFLTMLAVFVALMMISIYSQNEDGSMTQSMWASGGIAFILGLFPALPVFWVADSRGLALCGRSIRAVCFTLLAPAQLYALYVTFSRGAMLSLAAASVMAVILWWMNENRLPKFIQRFSRAAAAMLVVLLSFVCVGLLLSGSAAVGQAPTTAPASAGNAAPATSQPSNTTVTDSGIDLTAKDLLNPASMGIRLTYWRVGFSMFLHNFWTGVGLGNFGVAYAQFQYPGAGDVQLAHNGFLQAFCETGVVGGFLLLAFWAAFMLWGARRIIQKSDRDEKLVLLGLYAGILAFLLHTVIDIHFSHPSLMMFLMIFCGLFYMRASLGEPEPLPSRKSAGHIIVLGWLVLVALAMGMSLRPYFQDIMLARMELLQVKHQATQNMERQFRIGQFFMSEVPRYGSAAAEGKPVKNKPTISFDAALDLVQDPKQLESIGSIFAPLPDTPKGMRKLQPGEKIPQNAALMVEKTWQAVRVGRAGARQWVSFLEMADSRFPHSTDLAVQLTSWYETLFLLNQKADSESVRMEYLSKLVTWAEEALRRSPSHADLHVNYAKALFHQGKTEKSAKQFDYYEQALKHFEEAARLTPNTAGNMMLYADILAQLSEAYQKAGKPTEAESCAKQAQAVQGKVQEINKARAAVGL